MVTEVPSIVHKDYCSKCKRKDLPLVKYSTGSYGKVQYYYCRECTNGKVKAYYQTSAGKAAARKNNLNMWSKYPERQAARIQVARAVRMGELEKPSGCSICGKSVKVQAHHADYSKPLDVTWVCTSCHADCHELEYNKGLHQRHDAYGELSC